MKVWIVAIPDESKHELDKQGIAYSVLESFDVEWAKKVVKDFESGQKVLLADIEKARFVQQLAELLGVW